MANVLIFTETNKGNVKPVTLEILGKLSGHTVDVIAVGDASGAGDKLKEYFPYQSDDVNELSDDISYGDSDA